MWTIFGKLLVLKNKERIMQLKDSKTYENLAKSFAGECQAYLRYKFIEYGARKQGYKNIADLVDKAVYNEFNHARMFYTMLQDGVKEEITNIDICSGYPFKEKWDLEENLRIAAEDEKFEGERIYPEYAATAREEGFEEIAQLYEDIISVEKLHNKLFTELYKQFSEKTLYKSAKPVKWKCADCGYEHEGTEPWEKCPLCNAERGSVRLQIKDYV